MFMMIVKNPLGSGKITKDLEDQRSFRGQQSCVTTNHSPYPKAWKVVVMFVRRKKLSMQQSQIRREWNALAKLGLLRIIIVKQLPRHPTLMRIAPDTPEIQYCQWIISFCMNDNQYWKSPKMHKDILPENPIWLRYWNSPWYWCLRFQYCWQTSPCSSGSKTPKRNFAFCM